jgi:hypothetical protein
LQTQPLSEDGDHEEAEEGDFDVEKWAHEVMSLVASDEAHVGIEEQQVDVDERATVTTLMESTCGCKKGIGSKPCSSQFSTDHLMLVQASCFELTRSEQCNQRHDTGRGIVRERPAVWGNRSARICSGFFTPSVKPATRT